MNLTDFFRQNPKAAVAFSGGTDSTYLLHAAKQNAEEVRAYFVRSAFQTQAEEDEAIRIAGELGAELEVLHVDVLADERITSNPPDRCYFCKRRMFEAIKTQAEADGFRVLLDGTNASDDAEDRPGVKALAELSVLSPLRLCGLMKDEIRRLSREAGLDTWDRPACACLATRIPTGTQITEQNLRNSEAAEDFLRSLGLSDFRVRLFGDAARIQVPAEQMEIITAKREQILGELKQYYSAVLLDLEER